MATKKTISQGTRASKKRVEKPLPAGRIAKAAERAGIHLATTPSGDRFCVFSWDAIARLDRILASAAAGATVRAAVDVGRSIREVREAFATAMEGAL